MKPYESEPLPNGDPLWKDTIELGFNLDPNAVANGHWALTQDLDYMAKNLDEIKQFMRGNPLDVAKNQNSYAKDIQFIRDALQKTKGKRYTLWNPNRIHPLGFVGSLSNSAILKQIEFLQSYMNMMAEDLRPILQKYESAYFNAAQLLDDCETLLNPHGLLIASTRGKIADPQA